METVPDGHEVVATARDVDPAGPPPLLILDKVTEFLDTQGLGTGQLAWQRIGEGQSNITYKIRRGDTVLVLRRAPRPPLPRSAHDMIREARVQQLLRPHGVPVPEILAVCDDESLLGVPFYAMEWLDGEVITTATPPSLDTQQQRRATSAALVRSLVQLHAVDVSSGALSTLGKPDDYLRRQVARFCDLWNLTAIRHLPEVENVAGWLTDNLPRSQATSVVHGDYRLGNLMFRRQPPATPLAILDWEMATLGDPLSDLGYLTATYTDPASKPHPLQLSPVTARSGYLRAEELVAEYGARSALDLRCLPWYQALAMWKAAIFCEAIYARWLRGDRPHDSSFAPQLEVGVPTLLAQAMHLAHDGAQRGSRR